MVLAAVFHGDPAQRMALMVAVQHHCTCEGNAEVTTGHCPAHRALLDQRFLNGALFARWLSERLLAEEFKQVDALGSLLLLLKDNPAAIQGFIGGLVASLIVNFITWRWTIRRRRHNGHEGE